MLCVPSSCPQWPKSQMTSAAVLNTVAEQHLPSQDASICNIIDIDCFNDYSRLLATSVYVYRFCYCKGITGPQLRQKSKLSNTLGLNQSNSAAILRSYHLYRLTMHVIKPVFHLLLVS